MITYGIIALVIGVIGWAFHRSMAQSRPVSTVVMYAGLGIGAILIAIGVILLVVPSTGAELRVYAPSGQ